jgi:hypothetical protein
MRRVMGIVCLLTAALVLSARPALADDPVFHEEIPAAGSITCGDTTYTITSGYTIASGTFEFILHEVQPPDRATYQIGGAVFHDVVALDQDGNTYLMRGSFRVSPLTLVFEVPIIDLDGGGLADTVNVVFHSAPGGEVSLEFGSCDLF